MMAALYPSRPVVLELLPAAAFFLVNQGWGLTPATIAVMAATLVAVLAGYVLDRRVPVIAVVTLLIVLVLSSASLVFDDDRFLKIKPTIAKCLFASALLVGLAFRPTFMERVLGGHLSLTERGWRVLTFCWAGFAVSLAVLNELVWRAVETNTWITFKTVLVPASLVGYVVITRAIAPVYWQALPKP